MTKRMVRATFQKAMSSTRQKGRILFFCPDRNVPIGGAKMAYRQADILCEAGYSAFALHVAPQFRYTWFSNETPTLSSQEIEWSPEDILVIPEFAAEALLRSFPIPRKVIFNQNCYLTFSSPSVSYADPSIEAVLCVSEDSQRYLTHAFPAKRTFRVHLSVDSSTFYANFDKEKQIAYMPRKNQDHAAQVLGILRNRGVLKNYSIAPIDGVDEKEVAKTLRASNFFLSFGFPEGWPLPPAEAMSCGALVVGYHGMGGAEYFQPQFSFPIPIYDVLAFAKTVENLINDWEKDSAPLLEKAKAAADFIQREYSADRERESILKIWKEIS